MYMLVSSADPVFLKHMIFLATDLGKLSVWTLGDDHHLRLRGESWLDTLFLKLDARPCGLHVSIGADSGFPQTPRIEGLLFGQFTELLLTFFRNVIIGIQLV